jgi:hypothetical protein
MMPAKRKTYTAEFKPDTVRLVTEQGYGGGSRRSAKREAPLIPAARARTR